VTILDARVHNASERNAKVAFWLCLLVVGVLTSVIAADFLHPILALFFGAAVGVVVGAVAYVLIRIWPVLRLLWWWTPEILLTSGTLWGFVALCRHTDVWLRLVVVAAVVGVPAAVPVIRRRIVALAWCLIVRHRLRLCFAQFIIANRSGSLPLMLWAVPTPVGERVWVWLRPGLSLPDLQHRLDKIAVACWASAVTVERANDSNAAYVRVDVKRRDTLTGLVGSPLVDAVEPGAPTVEHIAGPVPTALDLPDVPSTPPAAAVTPSPRPRPASSHNGHSTGATTPLVAVPQSDLDEWI
jgi:hypothetical protein